MIKCDLCKKKAKYTLRHQTGIKSIIIIKGMLEDYRREPIFRSLYTCSIKCAFRVTRKFLSKGIFGEFK